MSAAPATLLTNPQWIISSSARTHIGRVRTVNEDRLLNRADRGLFAIADGMGGHSRGDAAAEAVIHALARAANDMATLTADGLCSALHGVNKHVHAFPHGARGQSGSTIAGLHIFHRQAFFFWAGDSRIYRLRNGRLEAMTHDHRVVQEMIDAGVLDARAAGNHPHASVITRAVGAQPTLLLATADDKIEEGDTYLLCSDGLTDLIDDITIRTILDLPHSLAADALLKAALSSGGRDNISLIVLTIARPTAADVEAAVVGTLHSMRAS